MKKIIFTSSIFILVFCGCQKENLEQQLENPTIQPDITGYWEVSSVQVNGSTSIDIANWAYLVLSIFESEIITSGLPNEAKVIWPSGNYLFSIDGKTIDREDGITMNYLNSGNGISTFQVDFTIPDGINSSINQFPLDGDYTFSFKRREYIDPSTNEGVYYKFKDFIVKYYQEKDNDAPGYPLEKCFEIVEFPVCGEVHSNVAPHGPNLFFEVWCKENPDVYVDHFNRRSLFSLKDTIRGSFDQNNLLIKINYN